MSETVKNVERMKKPMVQSDKEQEWRPSGVRMHAMAMRDIRGKSQQKNASRRPVKRTRDFALRITMGNEPDERNEGRMVTEGVTGDDGAEDAAKLRCGKLHQMAEGLMPIEPGGSMRETGLDEGIRSGPSCEDRNNMMEVVCREEAQYESGVGARLGPQFGHSGSGINSRSGLNVEADVMEAECGEESRFGLDLGSPILVSSQQGDLSCDTFVAETQRPMCSDEPNLQ